MTMDIATILGIDGIATGAIYALVAIGTVLIFTVTRVIFIPFGDIAAFTALTLAALETKRVPGTFGLVIVLACLACLMEVVSLVRGGALRETPRAAFFYLALPLMAVGIVWVAMRYDPPMAVRIVLALLLIMPISPLLDRIVFRPVADASVLLLLTVSVALHFALVGLGLLFFGPEGVRTEPLTAFSMEIAGIHVSGQTILMAGVSGILIAPVNTIFYDSGFLIGLKAFVGAIVGGMTSYPGAALGSLGVGILESFASFQSGAFKDVIVFSLLIPILLWRSLASEHSEEEVEE